ncbi:hypothetical protein CUS68_12475, partial [Enterococcus faecium]
TLIVSSCRRSSHPRRLIVKDNRNSIRKEVLHLIKFVKKTVAIPIVHREVLFSVNGCGNFILQKGLPFFYLHKIFYTLGMLFITTQTIC